MPTDTRYRINPETYHFVTLFQRDCQDFMEGKQNQLANRRHAFGTTSSSPPAYFTCWKSHVSLFLLFLQMFYTGNHIFHENGFETINIVFLCEKGIPKSSKFRCKRETICIVIVERDKHCCFVLHMLAEKTILVLSFVRFRV